MRPVTLFLSNITWDFVWQRHQTLASLFARDSEVVFCEIPGVRRVGWRDLPRILARLRQLVSRSALPSQGAQPPAGIRLVRPFVLPATNRFFCALNARLLTRWLSKEMRLRGGVSLIVNYSPARTALQILDRVPHQRLIYDCTDDWLAVRDIPEFLQRDERTLLARADLTLVPSRRLEKLKNPYARRLERLAHGACVERFLMKPCDRAAGANVTLLYYGHLHRQHLDFALLEQLAIMRPVWRIMLIGPVNTPYRFPPNVQMVGQQAHDKLRDFIAHADVLLLPYVINDYTRAVLPAKIYECLATGRPIVATPLPELIEDFSSHLQFGVDAREFVAAVEMVLVNNTASEVTERVNLARANTWERRYSRLQELLQNLPAIGEPKS